MQKIFQLTDSKIKLTRRVEAIKGDIRKYIKRERKKKLPEGFDFWDFNCSFGDSSVEKKKIHVTEIVKFIDDAACRKLDCFYLEVLSIARSRSKYPNHEDVGKTDKKPI